MEHGSSSFSFATQRKVAAGCRVCEGTLFTPKIKENRYCYQSARKKIACGAQCGYSFLIPYRRRRCAAGRNPTPHGRTCGAAPTLRAGPNNLPKISARPPLSYFPLIKGRAHARCQTVEYGVFVHPLVLSSGARHGQRIARPHGVTVLKLELSASTTTQAPAAMGAEGLITQEELPAEPDSGSEGSSTPLCPPWRPAGSRLQGSLSPR